MEEMAGGWKKLHNIFFIVLSPFF